MIKFINLSKDEPYQIFKNTYDEALKKNQEAIDAVCISSFDINQNQPDARYVNLKYIKGDEWIFFSNYEGSKDHQFRKCNNISATFYWQKTNTQIRIKAKIKKTDSSFSDQHFSSRNKNKNAIAISSKQSHKINSFDEVIAKYKTTLESQNLFIRPDYWGGYYFTPSYFEFWYGHESRINKRVVFSKFNQKWKRYVLEP